MEKYRILLSGKNNAIMDDFFFHMTDDFKMLSTSMRVEDLVYHLELFRPDALVLCLGGDSKDIRNSLLEQERKLASYGVNVFVVGSKEDCEDFQRISLHLADMVMQKPISVDDIRKNILRFMKRKEDEEQRILQEERQKEEQKKEEQKKEGQAVQKESKRRKHVLVIDDNPIMLKMIKEQLSGTYDVATAISGKIAYKFLDTKGTDMILLDYEMPDENGPAIFKKIREREAFANTPIIFLTGISDRKKITTALTLKPQGYLLKPIDKAKLLSTIEKFIG